MIPDIYSKLRRITSNNLYFPEIDGIRFLAILLVILFHAHGYFIRKTTIHFADQPDSYRLLNTFLVNSDRGVEMFFVLSGFILCLPFAHQFINRGKPVSLKKYYLRRLTRLEPPYLIAITCIFLLEVLTNVHPDKAMLPSWLASLIYSHSLIFHRVPLLTVVAWSLEIEIQFYLLAPLLFRLLAADKWVRRPALIIATLGIVCLQRLYPPIFLSIYAYAQYFFTGILLADMYVSDVAPKVFKKAWIPIAAIVCFAALMYVPTKSKILPVETLFWGRLALPLLIGLFYYCVLKNEHLKKVFSFRFIPIIGGMCYSIYLLHYTIISVTGRYLLKLHITAYYLPNLLLQTALLCIPILLISSVYYYYIERPFMSSKWLNMLTRREKRKEGTNAVT